MTKYWLLCEYIMIFIHLSLACQILVILLLSDDWDIICYLGFIIVYLFELKWINHNLMLTGAFVGFHVLSPDFVWHFFVLLCRQSIQVVTNNTNKWKHITQLILYNTKSGRKKNIKSQLYRYFTGLTKQSVFLLFLYRIL